MDQGIIRRLQVFAEDANNIKRSCREDLRELVCKVLDGFSDCGLALETLYTYWSSIDSSYPRRNAAIDAIVNAKEALASTQRFLRSTCSFLFGPAPEHKEAPFIRFHTSLSVENSGKLEGLAMALEKVAPYIPMDEESATVVIKNQEPAVAKRIVDVIGFFLDDCRDFHKNAVHISIEHLRPWVHKLATDCYTTLKDFSGGELDVLRQSIEYLPEGLQKREAPRLLRNAENAISFSIDSISEVFERFKCCESISTNHAEFPSQFRDLMESLEASSFRMAVLEKTVADLRKALNTSVFRRFLYFPSQVTRRISWSMDSPRVKAIRSLCAIFIAILSIRLVFWCIRQRLLSKRNRRYHEEQDKDFMHASSDQWRLMS
ncbi:hypothetical protein EHEL_040010 [Encephalitozoon hellem ATCC 50504]|uniref:Uncharacterized protein n=1 Tax=Encephalitozoon hellem TaxID=27973 RepID=A0A9Q9CCF3_ENCHE|nr:uncharacterized protein EHEL_040010 [Encephalitozoon hellem ATCC 50504]AFM98055.1 hypothetical protein EHEL_040010 [Encephalitozoon hellem ATCC 50504]UTX42893.1 hypothetical protein GPU96_04g06210 [Encephalitozoon hellem]UTX43293.1 hypothetical protein GPU96_06g10390 [Encephalitozoon hellem]|eukprot:XP_003887036.1 hypothetical protein EHEL_040010 [Encephalitozoon hellem ATCC 50504]